MRMRINYGVFVGLFDCYRMIKQGGRFCLKPLPSRYEALARSWRDFEETSRGAYHAGGARAIEALREVKLEILSINERGLAFASASNAGELASMMPDDKTVFASGLSAIMVHKPVPTSAYPSVWKQDAEGEHSQKVVVNKLSRASENRLGWIYDQYQSLSQAGAMPDEVSFTMFYLLTSWHLYAYGRLEYMIGPIGVPQLPLTAVELKDASRVADFFAALPIEMAPQYWHEHQGDERLLFAWEDMVNADGDKLRVEYHQVILEGQDGKRVHAGKFVI